MTEEEDDIEEYLDPELDPVPDDSDGWMPELFSKGGLIVGLHFLVAGSIMPLVWVAFQQGEYMLVGFYSMLSALMIVAGFVVGRIASRR